MKFDCGCEISKDSLDYDNIDENCPRVWELLSEGRTKGIFQLESHLGQTWCKRLKPQSIEHLAALGALLRPGCLKAYDEDGISMTEHYCRRKNGEEPVVVYHEALEDILSDTYQIIVYQENSMAIATKLAGFNLQQADDLRKSIGKKDASKMAEVKKVFMEGCETQGLVDRDTAYEIFGWIEKSQRYAFNKSHAVAYAINGYLSAYVKAHFPVEFFTSWFYYSKYKPKPFFEIKSFYDDAKSFDVGIDGPSFFKSDIDFSTKNNKVVFGLSNIKGIGKVQAEKIIENRAKYEDWFKCLVNGSLYISNKSFTLLIESGAFSDYNMSRNSMLFEFSIWSQLTDKEQEHVRQCSQQISSLKEALNYLGDLPKVNKNRQQKIKDLFILLNNPPMSLSDTPEWISKNEKKLLGVSLSCSILDSCDISSANRTCNDILRSSNGRIAVEIERVFVTKCKKGKNIGRRICFCSGRDDTGTLESIMIPPDIFVNAENMIYEGNTLLLGGFVPNSKDIFIINEVSQI